MNTRTPLESPGGTVVLSVSFNPDCSLFAVGLNTGFRVFDSDPCNLRTTREFNAGVGLIQLLGSTNYFGLVGGGRQPKFAANKLVVWDDMRSKTGLEISCLTPVRGVQLSKEQIVVVLQNSVRVYKFSRNPSLLSVYETANNPWGLCCLSPVRMAFPGRTTGHVHLVEIATGNVSIIPAHTSAVKAMQLSSDGELLATASETGTLIRVFATSNCARLVELRRGIDPATIFSLAFNPPGTMLACTSDKSTLHIFDVPSSKKAGHPQSQQQQQQPLDQSVTNSGSSATPTNANDGRGRWGILSRIPMMPRVFSDVYSFASAPFDVDNEDENTDSPTGRRSSRLSGPPMSDSTTLGTSRPPKGVIGWVGENTLVVVGAGRDARWEKFAVVQEGPEGKRYCVREGWKRYLGGP